MKLKLNEKAVRLIIRYVLGVVFIVAGVSKLFDPKLLVAQIVKTGISNPLLLQIFSYGLVGFEIVLGLLLLFRFRQWVAVTTGAVLAGFCLFLAYLVYTHDPSTCGCFGNFLHFSNKQELSNNLVLIIGIIYIS